MLKKIILSLCALALIVLMYFQYGRQENSSETTKIDISKQASKQASNNHSIEIKVDDKVDSNKNINPENFAAEIAVREDDLQGKIEKSKEILAKEFDYGKNEPVVVGNSSQKNSVLTALKEPSKYPERLSVAHLPAAFDLNAYQKDPAAYLNIIEPARVFQSAQPDASAVVILRISEKCPVIKQGLSTILIVKALPEMPVSFTSFDLGRFENDLTSITVKANKEGIAQTVFTGSAGTIAKVNILASCPLTSGQVKFVVEVVK